MRGLIACQLVGDNHPRHIPQTLEQFMEKPLGCFGVSPRLHQDVEHVAVLVNRTPQIAPLAIDLDEHLIEVPFVARAGSARAQLVGVVLSECGTPGADRLVGDHHPAGQQQFLNVAQAQRKPVIQPQLDRMELVQIDGYTEDDKVAIARDYLLPRQRERAALNEDEVTVTDAALRKIAADYTREPGVRQFERLLAKALRKVTTKLAEDPGPKRIDEPDLVSYLGRPRITPESAERTAVPGVATGLAVTGLGGDVLYIEAGGTDGEPGLQLDRAAR
jgi:hypothetical protein